ncbi:MAG: hypothetical protein WA637_18685 [Terriglobales bacterium]
MKPDKFIEEIRKFKKLNREAQATRDPAIMSARLKNASEWIQNSPYSPKNFPILEEADEIAKKLYGKSFKEMNAEKSEDDPEEPN